MASRRQIIDAIKTQLDRFDEELSRLERQSTGAASSLKADLAAQMEELERAARDAGRRFEKAKDAGKESWEVLRQGVEAAWRELQKSVEEIKENLKEDARRDSPANDDQ